jgi:nucleoside 2-deoxyribosyltransferase
MNIYFACSITGGRQDEKRYQELVAALEGEGHNVPTAGLASSDLELQEGNLDPQTVYQRDTDWIRGSDVLIAEISTPSHGVGYEVGYALRHQIPVLCLYRRGKTVSKMITGNQDPRLTTYAYSDLQDAICYMLDYISALSR